MDLSSPRLIQSPLVFPFSGEPPLEAKTSCNGRNKENPFVDTFDMADPLCQLNLKETSDFVKSFPVMTTTRSDSVSGSAQRKRENVSSATQRRISLDSPSTPGRPVFSFSSVGKLSRKSVPSKWDDAEKWVITHGSPAHNVHVNGHSMKQQVEVFSDKSRVTEEKVSKAANMLLLKDKFADDAELVFPNVRYSEPLKEAFLFQNTNGGTMKDKGTEVIREVKHRDFGTEMTPLASSTTSRCHTPFNSSSPARHNTPADRSGPLTALEQSKNTKGTPTVDISQLQECHFSKLQSGGQYDSVTTNWSSREEEEEEISKSLRHFETGSECQKSVLESKGVGWEEEEKTKCCLRYQREEAKIQAWVNLQSAKAEAQSRKLEVKIQKMRSNLEEKLMKRMAVVHRRAEEWRLAARQQHSEQTQKVSEQAQKIVKGHNKHNFGVRSCGCFTCNN